MLRLGIDLSTRQLDTLDRGNDMPFRTYPEFIRPEQFQASVVRRTPDFKKPVGLLGMASASFNWA